MQAKKVTRRTVLKRRSPRPGRSGRAGCRRTPRRPSCGCRRRAREVAVDLDTRGIEGWTVVTGQWTVEEMSGRAGGQEACSCSGRRGTRST